MAAIGKSAVIDEKSDESSDAIELAQRINRKLTDTSEIRLAQLSEPKVTETKPPTASHQRPPLR